MAVSVHLCQIMEYRSKSWYKDCYKWLTLGESNINNNNIWKDSKKIITCGNNNKNGYNDDNSSDIHSDSETALLKVVNDLFLSHDKCNISVLALLDFSSAFDTIDHTIHVHRLHTDFGFTDNVLQWFSSYLTDRTHYVSLCNHCSDFAPVHSGAPQSSVRGPMLFTIY